MFPTGKPSYEKRSLTKEDIRGMSIDDKVIEEFIALIKEGDNVYYEKESTGSRGYQRIVGRRPSGLIYCYVISSWMS